MIKLIFIGLILILVLFLYCACVLSSRCSLEANLSNDSFDEFKVSI